MERYKKISNRLFGWLSEKLLDEFDKLKASLQKSDFKILYRTYISIILSTSFFVFLGFFAGGAILLYTTGYAPLYALMMSFGIGMLASSVTFVLTYYYPLYRAGERSRSIKSNLPFAINHMSAIASAKVPPYVVFKLMAEFEEYGEVSTEAQKIVRDVDVFGHDITTALKQAAERTPSDNFEEFLSGLVSVEKTGGNLEGFMNVQAEEAMFNYKQKRKRYLDTLSTYADFYTAVLIAAPLFLVAVLTVMSMVGGDVMGMSIQDAMSLGIYGAIPTMNSLFIIFIHFTQPEVV
ncbi:MAG: type II secretion system F family protein [Candidatus Aenigmatarchaeota archaeon]